MLRLPAYCQRIFCSCFACSCRFGAVAWKWKYFSLKRHMSRHGTTRSGDIVWHWYGARNCCDIINVYVLEIYLCLIRINFNSGKSSVFEDGLIASEKSSHKLWNERKEMPLVSCCAGHAIFILRTFVRHGCDLWCGIFCTAMISTIHTHSFRNYDVLYTVVYGSVHCRWASVRHVKRWMCEHKLCI